MPTVEVTGPGVITGSFEYQGITFYGWTFPVVVDGQAGVYTVWVDTNNPADAPGLVNDVVNDLTADPGLLDGISMNDPGTDDRSDEDRGDDRSDGDDGDDDGMVADGDIGAGDGDSV